MPEHREKCLVGFGVFWPFWATFVAEKALYDLKTPSRASETLFGFLMKIEWSVTNLTAIVSSVRAESTMFVAIFDIF